MVEKALDTTTSLCEKMGRNQACYGNQMVRIEPRLGVEGVTFAAPGDIVDVSVIDTLRSSPLDVATDTWGIAMLKLQANVPNTLPGQAVQFLLFGDTTLQRSKTTTDEPTIMQASAKRGLNIRQGPSTDFAIIGGLASNDMVTVTGRLADNSWLRIMKPEDNAEGWIFASLLTVEGNVEELDVAQPTQRTTDWDTMQVFYFNSNVGELRCNKAPRDGILIQTPEGSGEVTFTINEVTVRLASSAFIQAIPDDEMRVNMILGRGRIEAFGVEQIALQGTRVRIPIDAQLAASGPPSPPEPCVAADMQGLPVDYWSCTLVEVHIPYECPATVPNNMDLLISLPTSLSFESREAGEAAAAASDARIEVNGQPVSFNHGIYPIDGGRFGYDVQYNWNEPDPGVYQVVGFDPSGRSSECTLTVVEPQTN